MEIKLEKGENRKHYLARVCIAFLEDDSLELIKYDDADCDRGCLADDLKIEYNLEV